ncbi:autotransporter-associated beta strand repeat-containing protein [Verrucomicrobiota bacterium sgz303538]
MILGPSGGTIDTRFNTISVSSSIAGAGALKKVGTGTLALGGSSTYTGGTVLQEGTVQISSNENRGAAGSLVTLTGGSLALDTAMTFTHPITVTSSGGAIGAGFDGAPH